VLGLKVLGLSELGLKELALKVLGLPIRNACMFFDKIATYNINLLNKVINPMYEGSGQCYIGIGDVLYFVQKYIVGCNPNINV